MATHIDEEVEVKTFPLAGVQSCLLAELTLLAESEANIRGLELPKTSAEFVKMAIPLDSLSVVDVLCAVEDVIGFELKDSLVRTGGYTSIDSALSHLLPKLEVVWKKNHEGK